MRFLFKCPACNEKGIEISNAQRIRIEIVDLGMNLIITCGTCRRVWDKNTMSMLFPPQFQQLQKFAELFI